MSIECLNLLVPLICLIINAASQIISYRCISNRSLLKSIAIGFMMGFISIFILGFYISFASPKPLQNYAAIFIVNSIAYSSLGYCYFHFINIGETGRRIRILRELYDSKDGLSLDELLARYNFNDILGKRITRLLQNRQVVFKDDAYYIGKPIMLLISKGIAVMRWIIFGKGEGIYDID